MNIHACNYCFCGNDFCRFDLAETLPFPDQRRVSGSDVLVFLSGDLLRIFRHQLRVVLSDPLCGIFCGTQCHAVQPVSDPDTPDGDPAAAGDIAPDFALFRAMGTDPANCSDFPDHLFPVRCRATCQDGIGVIYLLLYILGSLAFFMLMSFFTPSTQQTVLENGTSPSGAYRYEIIQTDDSSGGNVAVHVEPNDRDIHLPFLTFISNGYDRTVYEERPVPSEVGSAEWTTASRADITAQLLEISNDVTLDLTKAQKSVVGIPADTETVYLKDLTDAQLEQLGVPAENDVLTFSGKVCFRSYIAVLEDYFAKDNREISLFN